MSGALRLDKGKAREKGYTQSFSEEVVASETNGMGKTHPKLTALVAKSETYRYKQLPCMIFSTGMDLCVHTFVVGLE